MKNLLTKTITILFLLFAATFVNAQVTLTITNPVAVCSPQTVDITASFITTGSTGGGILSYWTDAVCTSSLASPSVITTSGVYYIKSVNGLYSDIKPVTVTINNTPSLTITNPVAVCSPQTVDLTIPSIAAGSTGGGTLSYWTNVVATIPLASPSTVSNSGTYYIKSTVGVCSDIKSVTVSVNTSPVLAISNPSSVCSPLTVDITAASITTGSTGGGILSYWTDAAATSPLVTPSAIPVSGTYYIKSTLGVCSDIKPVNVMINNCNSIVLNSSVGTDNQTICKDSAIANIKYTTNYMSGVTFSGLPTGVSGSWSANQVTISGVPTVLGIFNYTINSVGGNTPMNVTGVITVEICSPATLKITNPSAVCSPQTVDITSTSVTQGSSSTNTLTYWTDAAATSPLVTPSAIVVSGTYYIKSVNGSSSDIKPVIVTINSKPNLVITTPTAVCAPGQVDITSSTVTSGSTNGGALSYWTDVTATTALASPSTISISGTYYIKSTIGNCSDLKPVAVIINNCNSIQLESSVGSDNQTVCSGNPLSSLRYVTKNMTGATFSGLPSGVTGTWNSDTVIISGNASVVGTYNYTISSVGGIGSISNTGTITVQTCTPASLTITNPPSACAPATVDITVASITVGSASGITLSYWTDVACTATLSNPSAIPSSGVYYIKSVNGLYSDIKPVTVTINNTPSLTITNPVAVCSPQTVDLTIPSITGGSTGSGIFSYWINAAATIPLASPSTVSNSGTYYIKSIVGVCSDIKSVTVSVNTSPVLAISNPSSVCSPQTVDITVGSITTGSTGGGTLSYWTDAAATSPLFNLSAIPVSGTYYIKSTVGVCSDIKSVTVSVNTRPVLTISNPSSVCSPQTVDITAASITTGSTGGRTLSYWTDAAATSALATPFSISFSGTYYIKSTLGTCSDIKPVNVSINISPNLVIINNPPSVCSPSTVDITAAIITTGSSVGGLLSYWTDSTCTSSLVNPTSISVSGTYYIKSTLGTCSDIKPVNVSIITSPVLTITNPPSVCLPSTVDLTLPSITAGSTGGGALTYWTNISCTTSLASPSSIFISGTCYIKSTVGICIDIRSVTVSVNTSPVLSIHNPSSVCSPQTVDITTPSVTTGSTGNGILSYWMDSSCLSLLASPTSISTSGTYYIKSTVGSCSDKKLVSVTVNTSPVLSITEQKVSAQGQCDGSIQAVVSGVNQYRFNWSFNSDTTTLNQTGLCAGVYKITVTSKEGCVNDTIGKVGITAPTNPCVNSTLMVATSAVQLTGPSSDDGKIISTVTGGVSPYTYHWSNGLTTSSIESLKNNTYRLIVTDAQGCSVVSTGIIAKYVAPNVIVPLKAYVISSGESAASSCDGSASVIVSGGVQPYRYLHSNGTTSSSVSYLCQGVYDVKVIDANHDSVVVNYIITSPSNTIVNKPITATIQAVDSCYAPLIKNCTIDISHIDSAYIVGFTMIGKDSVSVQWKVVDAKGVSNVLTNKYLLPDSVGVFQFSLQLYCPTKSNGQFLTAYDQLSITQVGSSSAGLGKVNINTVEIYPNPFRDHLIISLDNNEGSEVLITDITGKEVVNKKFNDKLIKIDMNTLSSGSYIVTVKNSNTVTTKQIVK